LLSAETNWHATFNQEVMGSNPIALTNRIKLLAWMSSCIASQNAQLGSTWETRAAVSGLIGRLRSPWSMARAGVRRHTEPSAPSSITAIALSGSRRNRPSFRGAEMRVVATRLEARPASKSQRSPKPPDGHGTNGISLSREFPWLSKVNGNLDARWWRRRGRAKLRRIK
jgi:hypothetical protein